MNLDARRSSIGVPGPELVRGPRRVAAIRLRPRDLVVFFIALGALSPSARGQALTQNDFRVDLTQGLVLGSGRAVGLGGALTALAPGIDGVAWNPASYAHRERHQLTWFDWSPAVSAMFPGLFNSDDFFNNGLGRDRGIAVEDSIFLDVGLGLIFGDYGGGILASTQNYRLASDTGEPVEVTALTLRGGAGYAFLGGDVVVGAGIRGAVFDVEIGNTGFGVFKLLGAGVEGGVQVRPEARRWAAGFAARSPVRTRVADAGADPPVIVAGYVLPIEAMLPWELQAGFAYQLGPRIFHRRYRPPSDAEELARLELRRDQCERERVQSIAEGRAPEGSSAKLPPDWDGGDCLGALEPPQDSGFWVEESARRAGEARGLEWRIDHMRRQIDLARRREFEALPRRYVLLSTDVIAYGRVPDAIGIDAFIDQERRRRAETASFGFRLGIEAEPWSNRLKLRSGTYVEPGRNVGVDPRPHFTFGWDVRLFRWEAFGPSNPWDFRLGSSMDVARDYFDLGLGLGFWH